MLYAATIAVPSLLTQRLRRFLASAASQSRVLVQSVLPLRLGPHLLLLTRLMLHLLLTRPGPHLSLSPQLDRHLLLLKRLLQLPHRARDHL